MQSDRSLAGLRRWLDTGAVVGSADHQFPSAVPLDNLVQGFLLEGGVASFLDDLDEEYDQVMARRGR